MVVVLFWPPCRLYRRSVLETCRSAVDLDEIVAKQRCAFGSRGVMGWFGKARFSR